MYVKRIKFMNIRIAICDDERLYVNFLKEKMDEILKKIKVPFEIQVFYSGESLIKTLNDNKEKYDLLLLDVDMPGTSGIEAARTIRDMKSEIIIIFISAHEQYVFEAIQYNPFRYVRKNHIEEELYLAIKAAVELWESNNDKIVVLNGEEGEIRVNHSDIMYYEVEKRKLCIHLANGEQVLIKKTIREMISDLNDQNFIQLHSGCVVNARYIRKFSNYDVTLDNDERLIVSRTRVKDVKKILLSYWGDKT